MTIAVAEEQGMVLCHVADGGLCANMYRGVPNSLARSVRACCRLATLSMPISIHIMSRYDNGQVALMYSLDCLCCRFVWH